MIASKAVPVSPKAETSGRMRFVARQPILTADEKVFGYELLFRDGVENYFRESDADSASRHSSILLCKLDLKRSAMAAADL